eukprot:CAMPEP_0175167410 /NCGR_PEP_ID=MMETSP0087-20121206/28333_1 /TAXON_ID=136419 /ORGANISM="Unknown Unknown, Strain D1" /LENGTH=180 /DNA_ID=CAMNT_0016457309 /DNA_START=335 /DNA_END=878 /DNA_ORIENTATION=-
MKEAVKVPEAEDVNEWIAVNTVDFFNEINMLYGSIAQLEVCTSLTCPKMSAGPNGVKIKKPIKVSAPEYADLLMQWVESQLNDESIFPVEYGTPFPKNFQQLVKNIFKRFFRIYAHIYHHHYKKIVEAEADAHLNTCFKHIYYFIDEFKLVGTEDMAPLADLIQRMISKENTTETKVPCK